MEQSQKTKDEKRIFCENVKYLRAKYNLSRTAMAKKMGVCMKTLKSLENGVIPNNMNCRVLMNIYDSLGIHPKLMLSISLEEKDKIVTLLKKSSDDDKI